MDELTDREKYCLDFGFYNGLEYALKLITEITDDRVQAVRSEIKKQHGSRVNVEVIDKAFLAIHKIKAQADRMRPTVPLAPELEGTIQ